MKKSKLIMMLLCIGVILSALVFLGMKVFYLYCKKKSNALFQEGIELVTVIHMPSPISLIKMSMNYGEATKVAGA